jgi:hypothetical protein
MPVNIFEEIMKVQKPEENLIESLLSAYKSIAEKKGFSVQEQEKMLFIEGERISILLRLEFGSRSDFFETLTYMNSHPAECKILVMSSNSRSLPMEAAYTVLKKKLGTKSKWLLVDIEGKKDPMRINWSPPPSQPRPAVSRRRTPSRPQGRRKPLRTRKKVIHTPLDERKEQD